MPSQVPPQSLPRSLECNSGTGCLQTRRKHHQTAGSSHIQLCKDQPCMWWDYVQGSPQSPSAATCNLQDKPWPATSPETLWWHWPSYLLLIHQFHETLGSTHWGDPAELWTHVASWSTDLFGASWGLQPKCQARGLLPAKPNAQPPSVPSSPMARSNLGPPTEACCSRRYACR